MSRLTKKKLQNERLSVKSSFTPLTRTSLYFVIRNTSIERLNYFIQLANQTERFTIDTESDFRSQRPALIQIEMIHTVLTTVLLVETCHLSYDKRSISYDLLRDLFQTIFNPEKCVYSWGDAREELTNFIVFDLFTENLLDNMNFVDVQHEFKRWHGRQFSFDPTVNHKWGLQNAIATIFDEFLDKSQTLNQWSRGLAHHRNEKIDKMVDYAVNDCLAVTKLMDYICLL